MQSAFEDTVAAIRVPEPTSFYEPFEFHTSATLTQEQYDLKIEDGWKPTDPDYLTLAVGNGDDLHMFKTQRAILAESPVFEAFFASDHYLPGAGFIITLRNQSAACIEVALRVLTRMDLYNIDDLKRFVGQYYHHDQVVFLTRLSCLAVHLQVELLEDLANSLLAEIEHLITAEDTTTMASIIYNDGARPDNFLRAFVLAAIKQHMGELVGDGEWEAVVRESGPALAADLEGLEKEGL